PGRVEHHLGHGATEARRGPGWPAHHHAHVRDDLPVFYELQIKTRHMYHDIAALERRWKDVPALHIQGELSDARFDGDLQSLTGFVAHNAVSHQAVALLEATHGAFERGVKKAAVIRWSSLEVARGV